MTDIARICTVECCGKRYNARGLCLMHYTRLLRNQDVTARSRIDRTRGISSEVVRLYTIEKWSTVRIARHFGVSDVTASKILKQNGTSVRIDYLKRSRVESRKARGKLDQETIIGQYRGSDVGVYELARIHFTSPTTIKAMLIENGVQIKSVKEVRHSGKWKAGAEHPQYDPSITPEDRVKKRPTNDVAKWRLQIFTKNRFECQSCGAFDQKDGVRLQAHHIENWSSNKEKRYDVSNGITFCETCHVEFHRIFGKRNNNRLQIAQFIAPAQDIAA